MQLTRIITQIHEFTWTHDNYEVVNKIFMIEANGKVQLEKDKAIAAKWISRDEAQLLLKPGEENNEMYQAILKAFDILDRESF